MGEILVFTMLSTLLVMSPGPNSVLILKTVGTKGMRASFENIVGLVSATFIHGAISILGISAIIFQSVKLFAFIKYAGAVYLLYLGLKTIISSFKKGGLVEGSASGTNERPKRKSHMNYLEGFITQVLNPKVSMFYLAAFPQFIDIHSPSYLGAFSLVFIHAAIIFFWFLGLSVCFSKIKSVTRSSFIGVWVQRVSGGLLIYFGSMLAAVQSSK